MPNVITAPAASSELGTGRTPARSRERIQIKAITSISKIAGPPRCGVNPEVRQEFPSGIAWQE